jgi:hypothetical protein
MFCSISEAWNNDPVKEITHKLHTNFFKNQPNQDTLSYEESISLNSQDMQEELPQMPKKDDIIHLSDMHHQKKNDIIPHLRSPELHSSDFFYRPYDYHEDYAPYEGYRPRHYSKRASKHHRRKREVEYFDSTESYHTEHSKHPCRHCRQMIHDLLEKKLDKMQSSNSLGNTFRESIILLIGAVIAIFIIILLFKEL